MEAEPRVGEQYKAGILPAQAIAALVESGGISTRRALDDDQIQPASLDLRLGRTAWRIRASFLPGAGNTVKDRLSELVLHKLDLSDGAVLETGGVYLVPLFERLRLPIDVAASTNPKSSTGRLDVFTRVIADGARAFDAIPMGYAGPLYLEIAPRTFPILVRTGSRLSQVRFRRGVARLSDLELLNLQQEQRLVDSDAPDVAGGGIALGVDLAGAAWNGILGFRAKKHTGVVDVDKRAALDVEDFWEPIRARGHSSLVLDPDAFYILASREAVQVPPEHAAEMVPFDPLVGEFRVHYAGFFDPGFGHPAAGGSGARAVLEVRSREVPFILEHGQTVGRLVYERMAARPDHLYGEALGSNYQGQGLKLSKHFRPFA
ncbi:MULTISPECIES: 2'-deoxycytidine 5'-triphosphate deaminase [Azorhizobium]|uniref:Putative deoxycytidine triphosphate deaminase protein n=1 Tax=Azorhizobium caulinodans (strain ATCC 43989 / DSM 5975 / JCM 20966 / LMG 6465 / NBRC 14845 / NCIMB 13405 / ORS 571) TaxID=438753 RepID=A8ILD7_AZOC5|nr:2'-deoxycytidine 5'-triphosphate deaminase [Azorhizobium sp. AG788]TDU00686.1 dCTP deaminase [Azorhizobium sp. AG788]BAF90018.1 putative deoxycytidine triphosphate deaminase protein [Azorhizobium caulinodans ORS 571]